MVLRKKRFRLSRLDFYKKAVTLFLMTDPLRYYLAEGFAAIFYFPNPEVFGKFTGFIHKTNGMKDRIRVTTFNDKKVVAVDRTAYPICSDFWLDYGVRCAVEEDARAKAKEWAKETNELHEIFVKQQENVS